MHATVTKVHTINKEGEVSGSDRSSTDADADSEKLGVTTIQHASLNGHKQDEKFEWYELRRGACIRWRYLLGTELKSIHLL